MASSLIFSRSSSILIARDHLLRLAGRCLRRQAGDHAEIVERLVGLRLALRFVVVGVDGGRAGLLVHQVAVELDLQALILGLGGFHLQLRVERLLLQLRIDHFDQNRVGGDLRAGQLINANDGSFGFRGNLANIFVTGDQGAEAAHLAQHGAALHGVGPDGAAVDGRRSRFQARNAHRDSYQHDQRDNRPDDLTAALLTFNFGTGDIHYVLHCASGEPFATDLIACCHSVTGP